MSHAVQRRLIHFEEVGANLCAAGLTSHRVIRVSSLHGTVLFLSGFQPQCYQGWKWCTQSYTVGLGQLELTGRDASIAADGLSTTLRDDLECAVSTVEENRRHAVPAAKVSNAPSPKKGGGSCKVKSQGKSQRPAQAEAAGRPGHDRHYQPACDADYDWSGPGWSSPGK